MTAIPRKDIGIMSQLYGQWHSTLVKAAQAREAASKEPSPSRRAKLERDAAAHDELAKKLRKQLDEQKR